MDRIFNPKTEKQTIYEIYRSCRLCGGGAGYKMPIVQNVIDLDTSGIELKQKIQECLQIEVHQDDKMPPLICELCVDKVNDFYDFMEMCRQINKRTRLRLGLPAQKYIRSVSDSGDCILGVTEPVYAPDDDNEPLARHRPLKRREIKKEVEDDVPLSKSAKKKEVGKRNEKNRVKNEPEVKPEIVPEPPPERKKLAGPRSRVTRATEEQVKPTTPKNKKPTASSPPAPKPQEDGKKSGKISKRELKGLIGVKIDDEGPRKKRSRDEAKEKADVPSKKLDVTSKKPDVPSKKVDVPSKKVKFAAPPARSRAPSPPPPAHSCAVCGSGHKSPQGLSNHIRTHVVGYTLLKLACNPCGEWFSTGEESLSHHRKHKIKAYRCRHCRATFKVLNDYDKHFEAYNCAPYTELPDKKCDRCWRMYPTQLLLEQHRCQGEDGRPGGKCNKCHRMYTLLKNLKKHESTCTVRKKGEAIIDPEVERRLMDTKIRLVRCDELLTTIKGDGYDVADVDIDFGFHPTHVYPYRRRIKSEPNTGYDTMVAIGDEVKAYYSRNYVHWDSDDTDSDVEDKRRVDSLTALSLKTIFSNKLLGKVPKRRRKVKVEKTFDNTDFDMSRDIDSIINSLGKDVNDSANDSDGSESIFGPFKNAGLIDADNAFNSLLAENDSQDTEKNFDIFHSSEENRDSETKVDDLDSQVNGDDDNCSELISNAVSKDSVVNDDNTLNKEKNDDDTLNKDENDDDTLNKEKNDNDTLNKDENDKQVPKNDCIDTNTVENDDKETNEHTITQETDASQNSVNTEDANIEIAKVISLHHDLIENNTVSRINNTQIESSELIRVTNNDTKHSSVSLENNGNVTNNDANSSQNRNDSSTVGTKTNGRIDGNNSTDANDIEMDDKRLMDALDAEIGENVDNDTKLVDNGSNIINDNYEKVDSNGKIGDDMKVSVDHLASKGNLKGMDLDCISDDEFNFDA